jgi:hypothetical protein
MSFSLGPKGGVQDEEILRLLAELTPLIKTNGFESKVVKDFITKHRGKVFVDKHSQHMHSFEELACAMGPLIQGIKNVRADDIPGDGWKGGAAENIFNEKDPNEPGDWWK